MRRLGAVAGLILLATLLGAPAVHAGPATPFSGSWSSTDPLDGSAQHLDIMGGTSVSIVYVDEYGTVCVNLGAPTVVFTGRLTGAVDGSLMNAWFKEGAAARSRRSPPACSLAGRSCTTIRPIRSLDPSRTVRRPGIATERRRLSQGREAALNQ
jgi:hypothetical protein